MLSLAMRGGDHSATRMESGLANNPTIKSRQPPDQVRCWARPHTRPHALSPMSFSSMPYGASDVGDLEKFLLLERGGSGWRVRSGR
jgi:hypothetical protein